MSEPVSGLQSLTPSAVITMIEVDSTAIGGSLDRFYNGLNELGEALVWQGETYTPLPYQIDDLEFTTKGAMPRPKLTVSNLDGTVSALIGPLDDLLGAKVTIRRTQKQYLDAVNFAAGNATADPDYEWVETFEIEQKTGESRQTIKFQLVSEIDRGNRQIPARKIQATICGWNDATVCPFSVNSLCTKILTACQTHSTTDGVGLPAFTGGLPFGGEPAAARIR